MPKLYVKELSTGNVVREIEVTNPYSTIRGELRYEVVMMGLIRNMDTDNFYVDDSEFT